MNTIKEQGWKVKCLTLISAALKNEAMGKKVYRLRYCGLRRDPKERLDPEMNLRLCQQSMQGISRAT